MLYHRGLDPQVQNEFLTQRSPSVLFTPQSPGMGGSERRLGSLPPAYAATLLQMLESGKMAANGEWSLRDLQQKLMNTGMGCCCCGAGNESEDGERGGGRKRRDSRGWVKLLNLNGSLAENALRRFGGAVAEGYSELRMAGLKLLMR